MIYYLCTREHAYTIGVLLEFYPSTLSGRVRILPYDSLLAAPRLPRDTYIFTDFDRLSPAMLSRVSSLFRHLESQVPVFNDPARCPMRFALLQRLHERSINDFNVYRIDEIANVRRYPVFVRNERGHGKPLSGLLGSADDLKRALTRIAAPAAADLMIVEFANQPAADGRYRKYGAFRVGGTIYGQHCFMRESWYVKSPHYDGPERDWDEHYAYVRDNPHVDRLREIFEIAEIDYGRVDYGLVDGRIQVFEINTNPTVLADAPRAGLDNGLYVRLHEAAMMALGPTEPGPLLELPLELRDPSLPQADPEQVHRDVLREVAARVRRRHREEPMKRLTRAIAGRLGFGRRS